MIRSRLVWLVLTIVGVELIASAAQAQQAPPSPKVLPGTSLALPSGCKTKVRWVCPPLDEKTVEESHWYDLRFAVDADGRPWIGYYGDKILSPTRQYQFTFSHLYSDLVCLENGALIVATSSDFGFVTPPEEPRTSVDGVPYALLQPITELPLPKCRLFAGAGDCLYFVGRNAATGEHEVYFLRPGGPASRKRGIREYVTVFSSKEKVTAAAGDGDRTYVAIDRVILKVMRSDGAVTRVHLEPTRAIQGLAYSPQAGLFFATDIGIGYIGATGTVQVLAAPKPQMCLQKDTLYVLFPKNLGVLALDNVADLKRFNLAVKEVPAAKSREVEVTDIRFFEAGEDAPEYADRQYTREFDRASTRYVYCQIDMDNLLYGKHDHQQTITFRLELDGVDWFDESTSVLDCKSDYEDMWACVRFGQETPGWMYPGKYTVTTYLNGAKCDERHITVQGKPTVLEAAAYGDITALRELLAKGEGPNAAHGAGVTALMFAVESRIAESVKLLLEHGADVNARASDAETALLLASRYYDEDSSAIVRLLLEHGADVNARNSRAETALHLAASRNDLESVRLLLEHGAEVNARDDEQRTALLRMEFGLPNSEFQAKPELVKLLLSHGADPSAIGKNGCPPLLEAVRGRDLQAARMLVEHGADVNAILRYSDGPQYSILSCALLSYGLESDRLDRASLREIVELLCERKASLLPEEQQNVFSWGWERPLTQDYIRWVLQQNDQVALSYSPEDPRLRGAVLRRLIQIAHSKILAAASTDDYRRPLSICMDARAKAEKWNLLAQYPEICYDCGILWAKVGSPNDAATYLQQYLDLAPGAEDASEVRSLMSELSETTSFGTWLKSFEKH